MRTSLGLAMLVTTCAAVAGCGGGGTPMGTGTAGTTGGTGTAGAGAPDGGTAQSFEPTPAGATWTYSTSVATDGGVATGTKTVTVERSEAVPGKPGVTAWRIHTVVPGAEDQLTWQSETATAII